ncbi:class I adenylate-forming enzyme family protein [Kitasatospora sp. NPDC096077]|uniref:class I adenylate-forming enzyme family protein n=1 Tax=Kitasatospora sp. NPDC096077 TaxID=3155544 RepID=UPI0033316921
MSTTGGEPARRTTIPLSARRTSPIGLLRSAVGPRLPVLRPFNIGLMAEAAAERFGRVPIYLDQPFAWDPQQRVELDYVEFAVLVRQMSAVLSRAGVRRWDRVAIVKSPNYDIQALAWACARIGAIPALLSARLDPDILAVLLDRLKPGFVVTDPATAAHARLDAARLRDLSCTAIAPIDGGIPVEDLWGGPVPAPDPLKPDDPMMITHTSSTTGVSKLAEISCTGVSFTAGVEAMAPFVHSPDELFASAISHVHVRATTTQLAAFSRGTPLLGIGNPDDETVLSLFGRYRPTIVEAHPNAFVGWEPLADHPSNPFASVRVFFNTFDAIHPRTVRRLLDASQRTMPVWLQSYGMTETQVVTLRMQTRGSVRRQSGRESRSVGWPVPGVRVRIADPATGRRRRSQTDPGMVQVRTRAQALAFVGTPDTFSKRRHGRWFDTGDWGRRGRWHQVEVLDRVADRIDGVESCLWIEDVLLDRIPDAEEVVVVPDGDGKPVPVVCMRDGKPLDEDAWRTASAGLTGLGAPLLVDRAELRRTATVKARRYLLTEKLKAGGGDGSGAIRPDVVLREGA